MTPSVDTLDQRYAQLVATFMSRRGVSMTIARKRGFGSKALCINGEIFAMHSSREQFVVKLPAERVKALVSSGHGTHFELSHGRPMQEWFVAGSGPQEDWLSLAEEALSYVGGTPD